MWKYLSRRKPDGTQVWAKVPLSFNGRAARSTAPETWCDFDRAKRLSEGGRFDGVGFVFDGSDGLIGIDLDECIDPIDGYSAMAADLLDSVPGYAEVSPSGTGIKMWTRVSQRRASFQCETEHGDIEFYTWGRYFTCTGAAIEGSTELPEFPVDALLEGWFQRWAGEMPRGAGEDGDPDEVNLLELKSPVEDFTLERVEHEILSRLDPDGGYRDWLNVGMALHHQFDGSDEALELWDTWSAGSGKYAEGVTSEKWDSFSQDRNGGSITLRSLIKEAGVQSIATSVDRIAEAIGKIEAIENPAELEGPIADKLKKAKLTEGERAQLVDAIRKRFKELTGTSVSVSTVRGWIKPERNNRSFTDTTEKGFPLGTIDNVAEVLNRLGASVRYNVISKEDEILIPGEAFTMDNGATAPLTRVTSECAKWEVPQGAVKNIVSYLAEKNQYNPAMVWIDSKPWDGVDRISAICATVTTTPAGTALKNKLIRMWLIGAVAIANNAGDDYNRNVLTFQGAQYQGKTNWLRSLVPSDLGLVRDGVKLDPSDRDSVKKAVSCWLLELGELDSTFDKAHLGDLKAWISNKIDIFRKPYAAAEGQYPRRTALFASVNKEEFLIDETGNTRFWVIHATSIDFEHEVNTQQLWAQVASLWRAGERWFLDTEEMMALERSNAKFMARTAVEDVMLRGYLWDAPKTTWATPVAVLQELGWSKPSAAEVRQATAAIARLNGSIRDEALKKIGTRGEKLYAMPPRNTNGADTDVEFKEELAF